MRRNTSRPVDGIRLRRYGLPIPGIDLSGGPPLADLDPARWQWHGACLSVEPELWFGESNRLAARRAMTVCRTCPVQRRCLAFALVFGEEFGIWGGIAQEERAQLTERLMNGESLGAVLQQAASPTDRSGTVGAA